MAKLLNTIIDGFLSSKNFVSGALGSGWKIWKRLGRWTFEVDDLVVRNTMTVFELMIQKIRAVKGALAITQSSGKIKSIRVDETNYYIQIEDEMSFVANDIIRCMEFDHMQRSYWVIISGIVDNELVISKSEFTGVCVPMPGDELVQFGNTTDEARQSAIYLHADERGEPAIDVLFGINSKNFEGCTKIRIGGDIPGEIGYKGFFCENGLIKSVNVAGETMYMLRPDGSGFVAKEAITWKTDGSGSIGGGAIAWRYDEKIKRYLVELGSNVVLKWENLSEESKENLKGEPGKDGQNGIDGSDGVAGDNGVSIIWKGNFSSAPANPQNGWSYYNTTTKKSYVYQNAWYVMTVDGSDGKNGLDGINGKNGNDGLSVVWKGDLVTPPANPVLNWCYRDTDNGKVYLYDGTGWKLMVSDGSDGTNGTNGTNGTDGLSVFITYHDQENEPARPTGNGTTGGWHTNATSAVIWMSQKVAKIVSEGEWGVPIKIKAKDGVDANLLPWVQDWQDNTTQMGRDYFVSPKIFSGTRDGANKPLTGVALGREVITVVENGVEKKKTGVFGVKNGEITFSIDENGDASFTGHVKAKSGQIGSFAISKEEKGNDRWFTNLDKTMGLSGRQLYFEYNDRIVFIGSHPSEIVGSSPILSTFHVKSGGSSAGRAYGLRTIATGGYMTALYVDGAIDSTKYAKRNREYHAIDFSEGMTLPAGYDVYFITGSPASGNVYLPTIYELRSPGRATPGDEIRIVNNSASRINIVNSTLSNTKIQGYSFRDIYATRAGWMVASDI